MRNVQDTFKTRERSLISAFSICMTEPLKAGWQKWMMFILLDVLIAAKYLTLVISVKVLNKPHDLQNTERLPLSSNAVKSYFNIPRAIVGFSTNVSRSACPSTTVLCSTGLSTTPTSNNVSLVDYIMINPFSANVPVVF